MLIQYHQAGIHFAWDAVEICLVVFVWQYFSSRIRIVQTHGECSKKRKKNVGTGKQKRYLISPYFARFCCCEI